MCILCIYLASFAQTIKPLDTQYKRSNENDSLTSNSSSPPPDNEHEKAGAHSSSSPLAHEGGEVNDDEVYELEFGNTTNLSDSRPKPVAKPRRRVDRSRHGSAPGLKMGENGLVSHDRNQESTASVEVESRDVLSHDQHPTPSRSAPAPPNATEALSNDRVSGNACELH